MKRSKLLLLSIFILLLSLIAYAGSTYALLLDREELFGNKLKAIHLDFVLEDDSEDEISEELFDDEEELRPEDVFGDSTKKTFYVVKDGGIDFEYEINIENLGGNSDVCDALNVTVEQDEDEIYDDDLINLDSVDIEYDGDEDKIEMEIYLDGDDPDLEDSSCTFDIEVKGWQEYSDGSWGFVDEEEITDNIIYTDEWMPDVEVTSPNGGEEYTSGDLVEITWDSELGNYSSSATVEIKLSENSGDDYDETIVSGEDDDGSYDWTIPSDKSGDDWRIKIILTDDNGFSVEDESDDDFCPEPEEDEDDEENEDKNEAEDNEGSDANKKDEEDSADNIIDDPVDKKEEEDDDEEGSDSEDEEDTDSLDDEQTEELETEEVEDEE